MSAASEAARTRRAAEVAARRGRAHACALDFLVYGDDEEHGRHRDRCVFGAANACSRDYVLEEAPQDERLYEGTALGALYGLAPLEPYVRELAGWNLR